MLRVGLEGGKVEKKEQKWVKNGLKMGFGCGIIASGAVLGGKGQKISWNWKENGKIGPKNGH